MIAQTANPSNDMAQTMALLQQIVTLNGERASSTSSSAASSLETLNVLQGQQGSSNQLVNLLLNNLKQHDAQSPKATPPPPNSTKPKRCLTAYNIFFQEERRRMLQSLPTSEPADGKKKKRVPRKGRAPAHGKISFAELGRAIGAKWKSADKSVKDHYLELAKKDKVRYEKEMTAWKKYLMEQQVVSTTTTNDNKMYAMPPPQMAPTPLVSHLEHRQVTSTMNVSIGEESTAQPTTSTSLGPLVPQTIAFPRAVSDENISPTSSIKPLTATSSAMTKETPPPSLEQDGLEEIPLSSILGMAVTNAQEQVGGGNLDGIFDDDDLEDPLLSSPIMDTGCSDLFMDIMGM